jgi:micrococcal nuclease
VAVLADPVLAVPVLAVLVLALVGCRPGAGPSAAPTVDGSFAVAPNAVVDEVIDGDTLVVAIGGHHEHVRLIGIDTPETVDPDRPVQCFGPEASARTADLLPPGTPVRLERDTEARDVYDRLLVYVHRSTDGLFVNLDLAAGGYADALHIEPNLAHARPIDAAVAAARAESVGLWGACGR